MRNVRVVVLVFMSLFLCPLLSGAKDQGDAPKVVITNPSNGAADVDPSLTRITVTFNKPMMDQSWSWSYEDKDSFPKIEGRPYYADNGTTCVLPVKLEPAKRYVIWINTTKFKNFKDVKGTAAEPHRLVFATKKK